MTELIPEGARTKHIAFLGATGSGKTSAAKAGLVEPALERGDRVVTMDPTGAWWGLRLNADGKRKGFPIYIFGGDHGDYPLRARDAGVLAETFAASSDSAIFDMSLMTVAERTAFFTEFAETIRRKNKGPLHLVIDEAHLFMPQAGAAAGGAVPAMLHAGNNLVSLGRSRGLRIALISQRPAKLHKDSLTQVQSLVAMRLVAPQDRKAIADWIADQADPTRGKEIIASLPTLKPGEAWVWSPQDDVLKRTKFPMPKTYDSSRAPTDDAKGPELAPVDMDRLQGRLSSIEAERKANDPIALRKVVIALEEQLRKRPEADRAAIDQAREEGRQAGHEAGYLAGIASGRGHITGLLGELEKAFEASLDEARRLTDLAFDQSQAPAAPTAPQPPVIKRMFTPPTLGWHDQPRPPKANGSSSPLPKGERACLIAAAQHRSGVTRQQLTVLTGYKRSSRDAYIQRLREKGFVEPAGDRVTATGDGIAALGNDYDPLPTGSALRQRVLAELPEGERRVLEVLIRAYPSAVPRDDIDAETDYKRSSRDAYLQRLSARELIETWSGTAKASQNLFD